MTPSTRTERRLVERLNRVANLTPGRGRIYRLDHIAMLLDHQADMDHDAGVDQQFVAELRDLSIFVQRLAYDLSELRDAVRGDTRRSISSCNDPTQWKGPRP